MAESDLEHEGRLHALRDALAAAIAQLPADAVEAVTKKLQHLAEGLDAGPDFLSPTAHVEGNARAKELHAILQALNAAQSEHARELLEEQLDEGLMDSFPASDPVSVVSTLITGCARP